MSEIAKMIVKQGGPVQNGPGLHGARIGQSWVYPGLVIDVLVDDPESPHDGWVMVVGPKPDPVAMAGTWKSSDDIGWVELTHLAEVGEDETQYLLTLKADGSVASCVRVK